jgi:hypothetical protein
VLSKGHASPLLYAILAEKVFCQKRKMTFRKIDSHLQGHPDMRKVKGVEMTTGSLDSCLHCHRDGACGENGSERLPFLHNGGDVKSRRLRLGNIHGGFFLSIG